MLSKKFKILADYSLADLLVEDPSSFGQNTFLKSQESSSATSQNNRLTLSFVSKSQNCCIFSYVRVCAELRLNYR